MLLVLFGSDKLGAFPALCGSSGFESPTISNSSPTLSDSERRLSLLQLHSFALRIAELLTSRLDTGVGIFLKPSGLS